MDDRKRLGLALGSGGARGLSHAGVLSVLEREGLTPDLIVGTSMGAIVGGIYAETLDAEETWSRLRTFTQDPEFLDTWAPFIAKGSGADEPLGRIHSLVTSVTKLFNGIRTITRPSLVDEDRLRKPLERLFTARDFSELRVPFAAVGVDLITGDRALFTEGDLIDAVYASAAIPGVFPPLELDDRLVVDGGSPYRVPIDSCRELGAEVVVATVVPGFESSKPEYRTGLQIMQRCESVARERLDHFVLAEADILVRPDVEEYHWADFRCDEDCRLRGIAATEPHVPAIRALVETPESRGWWARLRRIFGSA